jgi:predicted short-subunit dehydrogenase-like oxidoreductase (DUF2520 family)
MKAVLIGSGNTATILGRKIIHTGNQVLQVISEHMDHARTLAAELNCAFGDKQSSLDLSADIYIVAISDPALLKIEKWLHTNQQLTVHTAGSIPMHVLENVSGSFGVMYPLQSLHKKMDHLPDIPFLINACNEGTEKKIKVFVEAIQSRAYFADDAARIKYHAAAVVVNNFTNHLYALTEAFCEKENLDMKLFNPIISETTLRAIHYSPGEIQTGPALRNDAFIMEKHLQVFKEHPKLKYLYIKFTDSIIQFNNEKTSS